MTQSMLSDEQIEEIVYIVLNHGQVDDAVAEIREYLTALAPPVAPADDREAAADDVGALIVPETGVPLAEWPEVKALGDGSAITLTDKEIDRALLRAFRLSTQSKRVAVFREAVAALIQQAQEARDAKA